MQKEKLLKFFELIAFDNNTKNHLDELLADVAQANSIDINELRQAVDVDEILCQVADEVEGFFTDDELDALIAFYATPIGQSILVKTPIFLENIYICGNNFIGQKLDKYFSQRNVAPNNQSSSGNSKPN